jgi:hypothetical protein
MTGGLSIRGNLNPLRPEIKSSVLPMTQLINFAHMNHPSTLPQAFEFL